MNNLFNFWKKNKRKENKINCKILNKIKMVDNFFDYLYMIVNSFVF